MKDWMKRFGASLNWPTKLTGNNKGSVSDPFGDYDKDGVPNMNDCKPRNPKKQDTTFSIGKSDIIPTPKISPAKPIYASPGIVTPPRAVALYGVNPTPMPIGDIRKLPTKPPGGAPMYGVNPTPKPIPFPIGGKLPTDPKKPIIKFPISPPGVAPMYGVNPKPIIFPGRYQNLTKKPTIIGYEGQQMGSWTFIKGQWISQQF